MKKFLVLLVATSALAQMPESEYVAGDVLIKFVPGAPIAAVAEARRAARATEVQRFDTIGVRHWRVGPGLTTDEVLRRLAAPGLQRWIDYAEPNYIYHAVSVTDDPAFGNLWGFYNVGQTGGTPGADAHAVEAWLAGYSGTGEMVVGVIDTGIDYTHPDLAANIWTNPGEIPGNGIDDDANGYIDDVHGWDFVNNDNNPMDDNGHGSHVAGTIGAAGNNGVGVAGVNWRVKLMPLKFLNAGGSGPTTAAINAINYAANKKVRITSNSWGGGQKSRALQDAINASGALFVAAAGNSGSSTLSYPAGYSSENILSVAASDANDLLATFSNFGTWVDLAAPGVNIYSTYANGGYATLSGTSMATPHVSGAAALMMGYNPAWSVLDVKNRMLQTVDVLPSMTGKTVTGGRLNIQKALGVPTPTQPWVYLVNSRLTADANNNGVADPGESVDLTVTLGNLRFADATAVSGTLSAGQTLIGTANFGTIPANGSQQAAWSFAVDPAATIGQTVAFTLAININGVLVRSENFTLTVGGNDILLVNDAGAYESFYTAALEAGQYSYQVVRTATEPVTADEMSRFKTVIWFTGDDYSTTFTPSEQQELANYLDGKGRYAAAHPPRLFVSGQDIGYNLIEGGLAGDRAFYETYLRATYIKDQAATDVLTGMNDPLAGLPLGIPLSAGDGARNQAYPDEIAARPPAAPLLVYSAGGQAAIKCETPLLRLVYFAFGFEGIDSSTAGYATRADVLKRVLDWLAFTPAPGNQPPVAVVAGAGETVFALAPNTAVSVLLDGTGSYDADGNITAYQWSEGGVVVGSSATLTRSFEFGLHQVTLTVTDDAGQTSSTTVPLSVGRKLLVDDMEAPGTQPWVTQGNDHDSTTKTQPPTLGPGNLWHKSTRRGADPGHSPTTSWYYGIDAQGNYDTGIRNWGRLISPPLTVDGRTRLAELRVSQLVNVEGGNYENAVIQVSTDDGKTWADIFKRGNQSTVFVSDVINLLPYSGKTIRIGFFLDTRDRTRNAFEGWYVDDVSVTLWP